MYLTGENAYKLVETYQTRDFYYLQQRRDFMIYQVSHFLTINFYECLEFFIFVSRIWLVLNWNVKEGHVYANYKNIYLCAIYLRNSEHERNFLKKVSENFKFEYFGNSNAMGLLQLSKRVRANHQLAW